MTARPASKPTPIAGRYSPRTIDPRSAKPQPAHPSTAGALLSRALKFAKAHPRKILAGMLAIAASPLALQSFVLSPRCVEIFGGVQLEVEAVFEGVTPRCKISSSYLKPFPRGDL